MDVIAAFGSLLATEGATGMQVLTPDHPGLQLHQHQWTQKEIEQSDTIFVREQQQVVATPGDPSALAAVFATVTSVAALKEVAFPPRTEKFDEEEDEEKTDSTNEKK